VDGAPLQKVPAAADAFDALGANLLSAEACVSAAVAACNAGGGCAATVLDLRAQGLMASSALAREQISAVRSNPAGPRFREMYSCAGVHTYPIPTPRYRRLRMLPIAMSTLSLVLVTATATACSVGILQAARRLNSKGTTLNARRRIGLIQLSRWGILIAGTTAVGLEILSASGVDRATLVLVGGGFTTAFAFAVREPISDFLAAAALIVERTAAVGDEVELNGEIRGTLIGFGLRSVAIATWDGDVVYHLASAIRTFRNVSSLDSRATIDIDIPSHVRVALATQALLAATSHVPDTTFRTHPEVLGVISQHLDHYVLRLSCFVDPAQHRQAEYRLKAAAVDAVANMLDPDLLAFTAPQSQF